MPWGEITRRAEELLWTARSDEAFSLHGALLLTAEADDEPIRGRDSSRPAVLNALVERVAPRELTAPPVLERSSGDMDRMAPGDESSPLAVDAREAPEDVTGGEILVRKGLRVAEDDEEERRDRTEPVGGSDREPDLVERGV